MKRLLLGILCLLFLITPASVQAVIVNLTPEQIKGAEEFGILHKQETGILLNNQYSVGKSDIFSERAIVRSKWHKLSIISSIKAQNNKPFDEKEHTDILNDPCLQIDIIMFGHSISFAKDYQAKIIHHGEEILPEKIHADHFQIPHHTNNPLTGFPSYRATIRTYFRYDSFHPLCSLTLVIKKNGWQKKFKIDLENYK